jgi:hypothetical protein
MYSKKGYKRTKRSTKRAGKRNGKRSAKRTGKRSKTRTRKMRGGNNMLPFIGAPYNAADLQPQGNYLAYNTKVEAWPQQSNAILEDRPMMGLVRAGGGRKGKGKGKGKKQRGGGFSNFLNTVIPDDILTLGRVVPAAAGHAYDRFNGVISSPSSLVYPTQQPLVPSVSSDTAMRPPDILKMYNNNNNLVSKI